MLLNKEVAIMATCVYVTDFVLRKKLVKRNGKENYSGNLILTIYVTLGRSDLLLLTTRKTLRVCMGDVRTTC